MSTRPGNSALPRLHASWQGLQARERRLLVLGFTVVVLALLWWVALAPALSTLRSAGERQLELVAELRYMQALRDEALELQALPQVNPDSAVQALEQATEQRLEDSASLRVLGDQVQLSLSGAPGDALALWLADARVSARAGATEATLTRTGEATPGEPARWSGTLSLRLP